MSAVIACMHLKHSSCPTPHPSVICVELLRGSRQPITDRLAQHTLATQRLREDDEPVTSGGRATQGHPIELTVKPPPTLSVIGVLPPPLQVRVLILRPVIAAFHYADPTRTRPDPHGPARTFFAAKLRWVRPGPVGSV